MKEKLFTEICGLFNGLHFISIIAFFLILWLCLFLCRNLGKNGVDCILWASAILLTVLEILKIYIRINKGQGPDSWVPLYYCSLYLFAVWLIRIPVDAVQRVGYAFMTMGGILASIFFTFYPSTSLGMYPFFSTATLHSFFFHFVMCFTGVLILWKGKYSPVKKDSIGYFIFILVACVAGYFVNQRLGTNCMFLEHPFGLPVLQPILDFSKPLYMSVVTLAQASAMFWLNYLILRFVIKKQAG